MFGLDRDSSIWLSIYFPVSWLTQFGHGLVTTVVGPTQPYLARYTTGIIKGLCPVYYRDIKGIIARYTTGIIKGLCPVYYRDNKGIVAGILQALWPFILQGY